MTTAEYVKEIQTRLGLSVDGIVGPKTLAALAINLDTGYSTDKTETIKIIQKAVGVTADGILGPKTYSAILAKLPKSELEQLKDHYINKPVHISCRYFKVKPVTQSSIRTNKSIFGKSGDESVLESVQVPSNYPLKYDGKRVKTIRIHKLAAERLSLALKDIIAHYGDDIEKVAPGACVYDGSYNNRSTVSGGAKSLHAWGLAIDFDAAKNTYKMHAPKARLSEAIYKPFWDILEAYGFLSLGRRSDYDWMHCQMTLWG